MAVNGETQHDKANIAEPLLSRPYMSDRANTGRVSKAGLTPVSTPPGGGVNTCVSTPPGGGVNLCQHLADLSVNPTCVNTVLTLKQEPCGGMGGQPGAKNALKKRILVKNKNENMLERARARSTPAELP